VIRLPLKRRSRVLGAATFFLSLQLLAAASAHAQGQQPPTPPKARPSDSSIAHNVITWIHHVIGSGAHRHRIVSSPPLPRPRPPQLTKTPAELPAAAVEPKEAQPAAAAVEPNTMSPAPSSSVEPDKAPAVELNDAQPPGSAVEPNKTSPAPDTTVEPAKPPTVEPNEAQPAAAAVEPNKMSPAPASSVEPDKSPAEPPAAAVEQNEAPPRSSAGAVLRGSEIPD
jgi:hypothetical protein